MKFTMAEKKEHFIAQFFADVAETIKRKGAWHAVPSFLIVFMVIGGLAAYYISIDFFSEKRWDVSTTVYSGILAFNAITLALSWSAIGRILEIMSNPGFSSFLQSSGMFKVYNFYVSFVHVTQVIASTITLVALICILLPIIPILWKQFMLAIVIGFTLWALRWSLAAVRIVSDLIRHFAVFDSLTESEKKKLRNAVDDDK